MLPRIATQVTVPIPLKEPSDEGGVDARPALSPEALANLRAAVLLRLLEAMMRQIGRSGEKGSATLQLLDVLFAAMKALPSHDGKDNVPSRTLADLLSRLPAEKRPAIERLLTTALSAVSTRVLLEIIRNPGGADARRLAQTLLAAAARETPDARLPASRGSQRFPNLEAQLAASPGNQRQDPPSGAKAITGDGATLQAALRRRFEDGAAARPARGSPPRPATDAVISRKAVPDANAQGTAGAMPHGVPKSAEATRIGSETPLPPAAGEPAGGMDEAHAPVDHAADNDDRPTGRAGLAGATRNDAVSGVPTKTSEARATQETMQRLISGIVANLTEDDALVLRLLLEAPLPELPAGNADPWLLPEPDMGAEQPARGTRSRPPGEVAASEPAAPDLSRSEGEGGEMDAPAAPRALRQDENTEAPQLRPEGGEKAMRTAGNVLPQPDRPGDRPIVPLALRDGIGAPMVPYLPAQDDLDTAEIRHPEEDDEEPSDRAGGNQSDARDGEAGEEDRQSEQEADSDSDPDLARRRGRIEALVGPPDPGFVYYQKRGDYWT